MTEKRTLAQDEPKASGGMKRRKLLHGDNVQSSSPKRTPTKQDGNQKKTSRSQDAIRTPTQSGVDALDKPASVLPSKHETSSKWSISRCTSGRFLNLDPIFTADGRYVILSTEDAAHVFSISTSRIVRTLPIPESERLSGYRLSLTNSEKLFASTRSGSLVQWDWDSGAEIQTWKKQFPILAIDAAAAQDVSGDLLFALCEVEDGHREISLNVQSRKGDRWRANVILQTSTPLGNLRVVAGGHVVVAWAGDRLLFGHAASQITAESVHSVKYTWREVRLPVCATCLDVRLATPQPGTQQPSSKSSARIANLPRLDVALGESGGSILVYYDVLNRLLQAENKETENNFVSNRLHWHRKAVKAVRWSKDGNYLISGGLETVLVLWQLDTGRKQFLPHLSSPICNLVVSPPGNAYAIKLGDNSVMVLSTAELRPIANVSGLQLPSREDILGRPLDAKGTSRQKSSVCATQVSDKLPAVLHPIHPDHLLLAVSSTQLLSSLDTAPTASALQAFDIRSGQHISRQALTRTNVSVLTSGPQGTELTTPDIKLLKISSDGDWLATVDEWQQYPDDVRILHPHAEGSAGTDRELFLKFWHWDETVKEWQLVTRIDAPHFSHSCGSARVSGLAARPGALGFATVGGDAVVRLWQPQYRSRTGRKDNDTRQRSVRTWQCARTVVLQKQPEVSSKAAAACLDFSNDGSVLAVCWPGASPNDPNNLVHLIDAANGSIKCSREGLFAGAPRGVGFLDRYLVILSDRLVVWDIVSDEIKYMLLVEDTYAGSSLAVNPSSQTFAISFTSSTDGKPRGGSEHQLAVFEPTSPQPVFQSSLKNAVRTLLPDLRSGGYVTVDSAAQVLRIGSGDKMQQARSSDIEAAVDDVQTGLQNLFGGLTSRPEDSSAATAAAGNYEQTMNGVFGSAKSLADIFDAAPSFALPPVDVLFNNVVDVFGSGVAKA
ncbi:hypothetical protein VTO42DRAFT_4352 [Malbranchea cinnamomea]